jgi:PAS domain-containing protein
MDLSQELLEHFIPLESICNSILDGVVIADSNKHFLYWNHAAKEILCDKPDISDPGDWAFRYNLLDIETEGHLKFNDLPLVKALNGESFTDYRIMTKNSQHPDGLILSVNGNPLRNGLATVGAITTFRDVTEEVCLLKTLKNNKDMYERMLDLMPCVVFIKDLHGVYIYGNKCLLDIVKSPSVIGHHCSEFLPKESTDLVLKNDQKVVATGRAQVFSEVITFKDGSKKTYRSIRFPYKNVKGEIVGICAVSQAVSDKPQF